MKRQQYRHKELSSWGKRNKHLASLTKRQLAFIENYMKNGFNKVQAFKDAGYTIPKNPKKVYDIAYRVYGSKNVQRELKRRMSIMRTAKVKSLEAIAEDLERNNQTAFEKGKLAESNKALELLAKMQGGFKDKLELSGDKKNPLEVNSSEQIKSILETVVTPKGR